jgi:hypothetical protein
MTIPAKQVRGIVVFRGRRTGDDRRKIQACVNRLVLMTDLFNAKIAKTLMTQWKSLLCAHV